LDVAKDPKDPEDPEDPPPHEDFRTLVGIVTADIFAGGKTYFLVTRMFHSTSKSVLVDRVGCYQLDTCQLSITLTPTGKTTRVEVSVHHQTVGGVLEIVSKTHTIQRDKQTMTLAKGSRCVRRDRLSITELIETNRGLLHLTYYFTLAKEHSLPVELSESTVDDTGLATASKPSLGQQQLCISFGKSQDNKNRRSGLPETIRFI
jgi:hypothetical protein